MVYKLLEPKHELLQVELPETTEEELKEKYDMTLGDLKAMLDNNMESYGGIGLSANQIGFAIRAFTMYTDPEKKISELCFNPKIVEEEPEKVVFGEGCLTYPFLFLDIERPKTIKVEYTNHEGKKIEKKITGLTCRVFQHEYDHMIGKDFTTYVGKRKLKQGRKDQARMLQKTGYRIMK